MPVHPICHKTIHKYFTNAQLARMGSERQQIVENDDIARFLLWIATKPADFSAPVR